MKTSENMSNKNKYTAEELAYRQRLPLEMKEKLSMSRMRMWIQEFGIEGVYASISGGKDSAVMSHLLHRTLLEMGYEDTVPRVFANTGLELPSVRLFALEQLNAVQVRPKKTFKEVLIKYGYPIISKEVSECIDSCQKYIDEWERKNKILTEQNVCDSRHFGSQEKKQSRQQSLRAIKERGALLDKTFKFKLPVRLLQLLGEAPHTKNGELTNEFSKMYDRSKWAWLLDAPFRISNQCCNNMKKEPLHHYQKETGRNPFIGTMAEESRLRKSHWLKTGCNAYDGKNPSSKPLSIWTEQDILQYIKKYNLKIADAYGEVRVRAKDEIEGQITIQELLSDFRECELETSKAKRTGCIFCMFGINQDKERFKRLAEDEPTLCDYVMRGGEFAGDNWQPNDKGLGYWFVIEWLNTFGDMQICIPDRERYLKEYSTPKTEEILKGDKE